MIFFQKQKKGKRIVLHNRSLGMPTYYGSYSGKLFKYKHTVYQPFQEDWNETMEDAFSDSTGNNITRERISS